MMYKNKTRTFQLIILVFFFISCENELKNDCKFIENLSNDVNFDLPLHNESLIIYIKVDDIVYITRLKRLYRIKENSYKEYSDFDCFLIKVINGNLLSKSDLDREWIFSFKLDKTIMNEFNNKGLVYLRKKYFEKADIHNKYYLKKNLNLESRETILYIFFKNNFYVREDDFLGKSVTDKS